MWVCFPKHGQSVPLVPTDSCLKTAAEMGRDEICILLSLADQVLVDMRHIFRLLGIADAWIVILRSDTISKNSLKANLLNFIFFLKKTKP